MTNGIVDPTNRGSNDGQKNGTTNLSGNALPLAAPNVPNVSSAIVTPDKFDGSNFKSWQQKMHFFLTTVKLERYLTEVKPVLPPENTDVRAVASVDAWTQGDYLCRGYIQTRLVDQLYNVYSEVKTSKDLWDLLEKKYKSFNVGSGKLATTKFLNFKMVDSKPIMAQVQELQLIIQEIADEGMKICETFMVNCIIEKLPPGWGDFKNYLTYKQKALTITNLISRLQNE
ncbi:hypothetical protein V5N11_034194 [Cardamine amara subsp. amara]|uniref:Gag-pol polyprotein n=1 Tax=Cardamine amara subsp. amara TaxID=228776 RepID=A0ABD1BQX9_CARAN